MFFSSFKIWIMAILCRTPSRGAVEYARRTAVISQSCADMDYGYTMPYTERGGC